MSYLLWTAMVGSTNTSEQNPIAPTHEDFHRIFGHGRQERVADFLELARDAAAGVCTCLQVIHSSDLVREINLDAVLEQVSAPAIGKADASALFRLSIAITTMLRNAADEQIALLNT